MTGEGTDETSIVISEAPTDADYAAIMGALTAFNTASGYPADFQRVAVLLRDAQGTTVGGLWGKTVYGWMFVELLVVPDALRGRDLGTKLMIEAEGLAISRGCVGAWLTTFTYQARSFYERLGYEIFGELEQSPADSTRLFMRKFFAEPGDPASPV